MKRFVLALLIGLASVAHAQDAVQTVLAAAPQLVGFAGSPENFYSLVVGLTEGTPARLAAPAAGGFSRVTTISAPVKLGAADAAAVPPLAQQHLLALGNAYPSSERLRTMVQNVLAPQAGGYTVTSVSAGLTSFPPMSPLVAPYLPATR